MSRIALVLAVLVCATRATAHRLDEYLQYTIVSVERTQMKADLFLTPGVAVLPAVLARLDANGDGIVSADEQRTYAQQVLGDLSLALNGEPLVARLTSFEFPRVEEMKEGQGEVHLKITADLPPTGPRRTLRVENRHEATVSAYLVNTLVPTDPGLKITAQRRNESQSWYELEYTQPVARPAVQPVSWLALGGCGLAGGLFALGWLRSRTSARTPPRRLPPLGKLAGHLQEENSS